MGAVWLRAIAPSGPFCRTQARKLSIVMSFSVAYTMLHSTFLSSHELQIISLLLLLHALLA